MRFLKQFFNLFTGKRLNPTPLSVSAGDFLDHLSILSFGEREQLRRIGAASPEVLYSAITAGRDPFDRMFGSWKVDRLLANLYDLIPAEHRTVLEQFTFIPPPAGVLIHGAPSSPAEPDFDIEERDRLFEQLQFLSKAGTVDAARKARAIEEQLNALLDRRFAKPDTAH